MGASARLRQCLANEQPAGAGLDSHLDLLPREAANPSGNGGASRGDPATAHLPRLDIKRIECDLTSMHIEPGYDRHQGLL